MVIARCDCGLTGGCKICNPSFQKPQQKITLNDFTPDNIPTQKQVDYLAQFLIENFEDEIGGGKSHNGEGAIEMAVRLLLRLKDSNS